MRLGKKSNRSSGSTSLRAGSSTLLSSAQDDTSQKLAAQLIGVEAAAGFAAEPAGVNHADQEGAGAVLGVTGAFDEDTHDVEADVEADEISQGQRPHGVGHAELEDFVDGRG